MSEDKKTIDLTDKEKQDIIFFQNAINQELHTLGGIRRQFRITEVQILGRIDEVEKKLMNKLEFILQDKEEDAKDWAFDPANQVGAIGIVKSSYGYHVMKMVKKFTYDEIKSNVKSSYLNTKYTDQLATWRKDTAKYSVVKNSSVLDPITVP